MNENLDRMNATNTTCTLNEYGVRNFDYFSLVRKSDGHEVYTSLSYKTNDGRFLDLKKIFGTLDYYFSRINDAISKQLENPNIADEQKRGLKLLDRNDYTIKFKKFTPVGMAEKIYWEKPYVDFLRTTNGELENS